MSDERLELVTEFASLRAGDVVVLKSCSWCGGDHRAMLLRFDSAVWGLSSMGLLVEFPGWTTTVIRLHGHGRDGCMLVRAPHVEQRRLYRVVIPPAAEARDAARLKKLEQVR